MPKTDLKAQLTGKFGADVAANLMEDTERTTSSVKDAFRALFDTQILKKLDREQRSQKLASLKCFLLGLINKMPVEKLASVVAKDSTEIAPIIRKEIQSLLSEKRGCLGFLVRQASNLSDITDQDVLFVWGQLKTILSNHLKEQSGPPHAALRAHLSEVLQDFMKTNPTPEKGTPTTYTQLELGSSPFSQVRVGDIIVSQSGTSREVVTVDPENQQFTHEIIYHKDPKKIGKTGISGIQDNSEWVYSIQRPDNA